MQAFVIPDKTVKTLAGLKWQSVPLPTPHADEVLIRTHTVSLNPVDAKMVAHQDPDWQYPHVLGVDIAGEVVAFGRDVTGVAIGERICGHADTKASGTFAEYACLKHQVVAKIPDGVTDDAAAALQCAGETAYLALHRKADLTKVQTVLIHGGGGGVGAIAIQLAHLAGKTVYTTVSKRKAAFAQRFEPEALIDYQNEDVDARISALTKGRGVDLILNTIGDADADLSRLSPNGQLLCLQDLPKGEAKAGQTVMKIALGQEAYQPGNTAQLTDLGAINQILLKMAAAKQIVPGITQGLERGQLVDGLAQVAAGEAAGKTVVVFPN